jgi:Resolvase, N terminal domain
MQLPGFERLVAMVCTGDIGAVYCIEASRLARNGRDWHHLIDLCALAGTLVVDPARGNQKRARARSVYESSIEERRKIRAFIWQSQKLLQDIE